MIEKNDPVNPQHYRNSDGVQLIELIRYMPFSIGNAIKYSYRNARKENALQDFKKSLWYLEDYLKNPVVCPSHIDEKLISTVLSNIGNEERTICQALVDLYLSIQSEDGDSSYHNAEKVRNLLSEKIFELSR